MAKLIDELFLSKIRDSDLDVNTIESEFSGLRSYLRKLDLRDLAKYPLSNFRERIISYLVLNHMNYKTDQKINYNQVKHKGWLSNDNKRTIIKKLVVYHVYLQLIESGVSNDINLLKFLTDNIILMSLSKKDDEPYWREYILSLPSEDKEKIIIGKQYILTIPSIFCFKGESFHTGNSRSSEKFTNDSVSDLYHLLLGDLVIGKIKHDFLHDSDMLLDLFLDSSDIINMASYDYLYSLYKCTTLEEIISIPIDKLDRTARERLYKNIGEFLWCRLIKSIENNGEYSCYCNKRKSYEKIYNQHFQKTFMALIRSTDHCGNINVKHFDYILNNYL